MSLKSISVDASLSFVGLGQKANGKKGNIYSVGKKGNGKLGNPVNFRVYIHAMNRMKKKF